MTFFHPAMYLALHFFMKALLLAQYALFPLAESLLWCFFHHLFHPGARCVFLNHLQASHLVTYPSLFVSIAWVVGTTFLFKSLMHVLWLSNSVSSNISLEVTTAMMLASK